ncbi:MAG: DUF3179 domain-containing protein [Balneolaceae bacterium]
MFSWVICIFLIGCDRDNSVNNEGGTVFNTSSEWLVPEHQVINGGPGKDGIPPIENPDFKPAGEIDFIPDERRVLGIMMGAEAVAYPHQILAWHEIVNDNSNITITYCPLTATGIAWDPLQGPDFGTSGLIFRNNLVAYDRKTESLWSQMRLRSINGEHIGASIDPLNVIDTTWKTWKAMYPDSKVLTTRTGHNRDYQAYAYGKSYSETDGIILFPTLNRTDNRLNAKTRVHGIFVDEQLEEDSKVRVYEISQFSEDIEVIHDEIDDQKYVIIGSSTLDFAIAYKTILHDDTELFFEAVLDDLPVVMKDQEGNLWTVFGEAVEGPRSGQRLNAAKSYSGFWFAFRDMFTLPEIYSFDEE